MNSVTRHLGAESKAATLLAMRSARKEIFIVVEGDQDIDLYSGSFGMKRSNLLSCGGKENLMLLYGLAPRKGLDEGTIFFRDRDNDNEYTNETNNVMLVVTEKYDVEMEILSQGLFHRIVIDFSASKMSEAEADKAFNNVCDAAAAIGALRKYSDANQIRLNFDDIKYNKFVCLKSLSVNIEDMISYIYSKSKVNLNNKDFVHNYILDIIKQFKVSCIPCSKEMISLMSICVSRTYGYAKYADCSESVISRLIRVSSNLDHIRNMPYFSALKSKITNNAFAWSALPL